MSQSIRDTQRVPRSCIACSKRKIKCSKTVPCTACVRRGDAHSCARELVRVKGEYKIARNDPAPISGLEEDHDFENSVEGLRAKVQHLQGLLSRHERAGSTSSGTTHDPSPGTRALPQDDILQSFLDLHVDSPTASQLNSTGAKPQETNEDLLMLLPVRDSSEQIVRFSLQSLGWIHCALNARDFLDAHERFWDSLHPRKLDVLADHSWMALYLSILCVGSYFMEDSDVDQIYFLQEGFSGRRRAAATSSVHKDERISRIWYDAVLRELNYADFLGRTSLATVQALGILSLVHKNFYQATREYTLLSVSISIARALGMDRLGQESGNDQSYAITSCWAERKNRELGRRLWWTLVICDWMIMPLRPSLIAPGTFTTTLSIEDDLTHGDIVLDSGDPNLSSFSPLSYHIAAAKLASIVRPYRNRSIQITVENLHTTLQDIGILAQSLPPHLSMPTEAESPSNRPVKSLYARSQQGHLLALIESCRLTICLAALPHILDTSNDHFGLQFHGRAAATCILEHAKHQSSMYFRKFWGPRMAFMSAGTYLMLDLICFRGTRTPFEVEASLEMVEVARQALENGVLRGNSESQILERLVYVYHSHPNFAVTKQELLRTMAFAAGSPTAGGQTSSQSGDRGPTMDDSLALQNIQKLDEGWLSTESPVVAGSNLITAFDDFDFELFQQMPENTMDCSPFALSNVFLGYGQNIS